MMTEPVIITHVDDEWIGGAAKGFLRHSGQPAGSDGLAIYYHSVVRDAKRFRAAQVPVRLDIDTPGRGKAHVLRIVPTIVQSYIVRGSRGWLELNPYYQRWYWTQSARYATPLSSADTEVLCVRLHRGSVDDAEYDETARIESDSANRTPQEVSLSLEPRSQQSTTLESSNGRFENGRGSNE